MWREWTKEGRDWGFGSGVQNKDSFMMFEKRKETASAEARSGCLLRMVQVKQGSQWLAWAGW